jgi:hypothetical protein
VVADEPAAAGVLAVVALAEPAAAGVELDVSQAGPGELVAGRVGCLDARAEFRAGWAESPVVQVLFQVGQDGQAESEAGCWVQSDASPVDLDGTLVWRHRLVASRAGPGEPRVGRAD